MLNKAISAASDFFIFMLIFSFFNDNFMVSHFGGQSLKLLFILFYAFYIFNFIQNFQFMNTMQYKLFFLFWVFDLILLLFEMLFGWNVDFAPAGFMLIAIVSIILYFTRYPILKMLYMIWISVMVSVVICHFNQPLDEWTFRTSGGTEDPNEFATQLLAFLFGSFYLFLHNRSKFFIILSISFFFYGLFKAGSMSSFLVLGMIGSLNILRLFMLKPQLFLNGKALTLLVLLAISATQIDITKIEAVNNMLNRTKDTGTADFRMHSWVAGKHMIENNPVFGIGVNEFGHNTPLYQEGHLVGTSPEPHNLYIKLFAESGSFTFIFFMVFITYILTVHFKQLFYADEWLIFSMLISSLLMGLTLGFLYDKYFWLFIALVMNVNQQFRQKEIRE